MKKNNAPRKIFVVSLGCAKNWLDTEVMAGSALTSGMMLTPYQEDADIYLINTCSFIVDARNEADDNINEAIAWKNARENRKIVIAGCLPQRNIEEVAAKYPEADLFLGLNDVPKFAQLVESIYNGGSAIPEIDDCTYIYDENTPRMQLTPKTYAYVKIAEGCNHVCAFCAIPSIRGKQRSRPIDSIVREVKNLVEGGVYEILLIAQDTTSYGGDLDDDSNLVNLITALDAIEEDFKIRILYTHPLHFSDDVVNVFRTSDKLLPYVDIPLQHASTPILKAMKRATTEEKTRELVAKLQSNIPNLTLRSTFIVGFPGETEEDYQRLKQFIIDTRFDRLGVFTYSPEEGTTAYDLPNAVPTEIAEARCGELMKLQAQISFEKNQEFVGKTINVIIDGETEDGLIGRSYGDAPEVDNLVHIAITQDTEISIDTPVKIVEADTYDLYGEI